MKNKIFKSIYWIVVIVIVIYIINASIKFLDFYTVYFYRLSKISKALKQMEFSFTYKVSNYSWLKWPQNIAKNFEIKKLDFLYREDLLNSFTDIYTYDVNDICKKIKDLTKIQNNKDFEIFASQTFVLLKDYKPSPIDTNAVIKGQELSKQSFINLTNHLYTASFYYASKNDNRTALLLAYLPILLLQEIEANNVDGKNPYIKLELMELRNTACINLLFLANNTKVDKEIAIKISKNLLELTKSEPSLLIYVEYVKSRIKEFDYEFSKERNNTYRKKDINYFMDNIYDSKEWQKYVNSIYDGATEEIKNLESGKNPLSLESWQKNTQKFLEENNSFIEKDFYYQSINWKRNITLYVIANFPETFFTNFYDLYRKREESIAIMEGTAIALALAAYSSDKNENEDKINDSMPKNINELGKWLGVELPLDRMSKSPYQFYFADDYFLAGSPSEEKNKDSYFQNYLPYLKNRWVFNSQPSINGNPIPPINKAPLSDSMSKFEKLQKQMMALEALQKTINSYGRSRINF